MNGMHSIKLTQKHLVNNVSDKNNNKNQVTGTTALMGSSRS
jgi:hypothetical protein